MAANRSATAAGGADTLHLGPGLQLPLQAVTETFAILAKRGAGKTNTAVVFTEELLAAGQQVIVVDPVGVWWGLRSNSDGSAGGLPVVILGGLHGDLPLTPDMGTALARLLVEDRVSAVLDLSILSKTATRRLMTDFLEELYRAANGPLHLVVDEADLLSPQRLPRDMTRLLGAMDDVVRRGRARGLGTTLISQRPAVLNKDVLGQAEVLVALRMTNPRDVAAVDEWVRLHADPAEAQTVKASLPSLPVGTAWVWSPGWLDCLVKIPVRARRTFDSSATPKPGSIARQAHLTPVDVGALRDRLATSDEPSAAATSGSTADMTLLKREVDRLSRELQRANSAPPRVVEKPVLDDAARSALQSAVEELRAAQHRMAGLLDRAETMLSTTPDAAAPKSRPAAPTPPPVPAPSTSSRVAPRAGGGHLKAGARRMLAAAAEHHPARLTRAQLATLAGMRVSGGTYGTYLSTLRREGYVEEREHLLEITTAGLAAVGVQPGAAPTTASEVRHRWRAALKAGAARMFDELVAAYPRGLTRTELAGRVDMEPSGGTFGTYLSTLRRNGLVVVDGDLVTCTEILFLDP